MEVDNLAQIIKSAFQYYDTQNNTYKDLINIYNKKPVSTNIGEDFLVFNPNEKNEITYDTEYLGYFDNKTNISYTSNHI